MKQEKAKEKGVYESIMDMIVGKVEPIAFARIKEILIMVNRKLITPEEAIKRMNEIIEIYDE